mgnify:CR=1 FL=1
MKEEDLIVLKEHDSVNNAEWERSLLEGAGIWAMVRNEIMSAIYPTSAFPAQLVVRKEDKTEISCNRNGDTVSFETEANAEYILI